jgi:tetratricopeptide (TPR) repeat protein
MNHPLFLSSAARIRNHHSGLIRWVTPVRPAAPAQLTALLAIPGVAVSAESRVDAEAGSPLLFIVLFVAGIIGVSTSLIVGLTRWGHKQDQIQSMMPFCIRYLVESKNESEKIEAATALGQAKDPGALLILADVVNDENAGDGLRSAAGAALREMSRRYRKYSSMINDTLSAVEEKDHRKIIDLLIKNFENQTKKYVQSAYLIGREYMRLEQYSDARTWLQQARNRNRKTQVYINQITQLITRCSQQLFNEGDVLFKVGEYYDALERYALASHDMSMEEKKKYSAHLRLACTYCKLARYEVAYQETLLALQDHHKTDTSLDINKLLQEIRSEIGGTAEAKARRDKLAIEISALVEKAMSELT